MGFWGFGVLGFLDKNLKTKLGDFGLAANL